MYPPAASMISWYRKGQWGALAVGLAAGAVLVLGGLADPPQFFRAYLSAWLFVLGLSLGSLATLMIYHVTGGAWGFLIRRFLEAGVRTLPLVAVGFVPIALGRTELYPWTVSGAAEHSPLIAGQRVYLNEPFFFARAVGYFVLWLLLGLALVRGSLRQDRAKDRDQARRLDGISGVGLLAFAVSLHFAAVDWVMTIQPWFHSTIFGPLVFSGQLVSALALAILALCLTAARPPLAELVSAKSLIDLGNLLLAFTIIWTYMVWFQYLLGWIANLPYDAVWFVPRLQHGWQVLALALVVLHFALPVVLLLWRAAKQSRRVLGSIAALLIVMQWTFDVYQVSPPFNAYGLAGHWLESVAALAWCGLWLAFYLWRLAPLPILPEYDFNESSAVHLRHLDDEEAAWHELISPASSARALP